MKIAFKIVGFYYNTKAADIVSRQSVTVTSLQCLPVLPYRWTDAHKLIAKVEFRR